MASHDPIDIPVIEADLFHRPLNSGRTASCLLGAPGPKKGERLDLVVKWRSGPEVFDTGGICELISAMLAADLGLKTPKPYIVEITKDFPDVILDTKLKEKARKSIGPNFSCKLLQPSNPWPRDRMILMNHKPVAVDVFAFDALAENLDRRSDNPNLLLHQDDIYLIDHELCFSPLTTVIFGWKPTWDSPGAGYLQKHVFFTKLKGQECVLERFDEGIAGLSDERLNQYNENVPKEWKQGNDTVTKILGHLKDARKERKKLLQVVAGLLT
jgi:hypothetical protein